MSDNQTFHLFPRLPLEIQSLVWSYAFYNRPAHAPFGIYIEHRPAQPTKKPEPETGFYVNFPLSRVVPGRRQGEIVGVGVRFINGLSLPAGTIRLEGGWTEVGDPDGESKKMRERVLVYEGTGLPALLHCCRESRRAALRVVKGWVEEMGKGSDKDGKPGAVKDQGWLKKANGEVLGNVVKYLLGGEEGTKKWWKEQWA